MAEITVQCLSCRKIHKHEMDFNYIIEDELKKIGFIQKQTTIDGLNHHYCVCIDCKDKIIDDDMIIASTRRDIRIFKSKENYGY